MKRSLLFIAIVALAAFALSGCNFVFSLILDPDLTVENMEMTYNAEGQVIGMRITFANYGGGAEDVEYAVYLSYGDQVNPATDFLLYMGEFDIDWNKDVVVNLSVENDIIPYIDQNGLYVPEGEFYFGVFVDPDDRIEEQDETDNDRTAGPYVFGGGGTSELPPDGYEYDDDHGAAWGINYANLPMWQDRNFHYPGDVDFLTVYLYVGDSIYVETYGIGGIDCDTQLRIFDSSMNQIAFDDDGGSGLYSALTFVAGFSDQYYILVNEYSNEVGEYGLHIDYGL